MICIGGRIFYERIFGDMRGYPTGMQQYVQYYYYRAKINNIFDDETKNNTTTPNADNGGMKKKMWLTKINK